MTFDEILGQVLQLLQRQGRVCYRVLANMVSASANRPMVESVDGKHAIVQT
jgi:hypothetical protein